MSDMTTKLILSALLDATGQFGTKKTGKALNGIASSVRMARLSGEMRDTRGDNVRKVFTRLGVAAVHEAVVNVNFLVAAIVPRIKLSSSHDGATHERS